MSLVLLVPFFFIPQLLTSSLACLSLRLFSPRLLSPDLVSFSDNNNDGFRQASRPPRQARTPGRLPSSRLPVESSQLCSPYQCYLPSRHSQSSRDTLSTRSSYSLYLRRPLFHGLHRAPPCNRHDSSRIEPSPELDQERQIHGHPRCDVSLSRTGRTLDPLAQPSPDHAHVQRARGRQ